jgi:nicotinamidase-related amidase
MSAPVLLVIDLQQCLVSPPPEDGPRSTPSLINNVTTVLNRWRERQYPLIHIHHHASDPLDPLHPSHHETSSAHSCAAPIDDEPVRYKSEGSAFISKHTGTSLEEDLERFRKPNGDLPKLVIIGMDGAQCINSTTRNAADLGFDVTVVADACATFAMPDWRKGAAKGRGWSADETHDMAMAMAGNYAHVLLTEQLMETLE